MRLVSRWAFRAFITAMLGMAGIMVFAGIRHWHGIYGTFAAVMYALMFISPVMLVAALATADTRARPLERCSGSLHSSLAGHLEEVALSAEPGTVVAWFCTGCGATIYNEKWIYDSRSA